MLGFLLLGSTKLNVISLFNKKTYFLNFYMKLSSFPLQGATEYISALEWILLYSSVPVTFHVITNTDSIPFVKKIADKVGSKEYGPKDASRTHFSTSFSLRKIVDRSPTSFEKCFTDTLLFMKCVSKIND